MANPYGTLAYFVTQEYGCTGFAAEPPLGECAHFHCGIDLVGRGVAHPPIYVTSRQRIFAYGTDTDGANYVITDDGQGCFHAYWHLDRILCPGIGVWVEPYEDGGPPIGTEGTTGNSTGDHLHYEVQRKTPYGRSLHNPNQPTDPTPFLTGAQGGAFDMDTHEIVRGIYRQLDPHYQPSDEVIAGQANRLAAEGKIDGVLDDVLLSKPWRDPSAYNVQALVDYYRACGFPEDKAREIALGHVGAGHSFGEVMQSDVATWKQWIAQAQATPAAPEPVLNAQDAADRDLGRAFRQTVAQASTGTQKD
jgi:hypothetical protein